MAFRSHSLETAVMERPTPERLAAIRQRVGETRLWVGKSDATELLAEVDALTQELHAARKQRNASRDRGPCAYCGHGPCPHPDIFNPALGPLTSCRHLHPENCR